MNRQKTSFDRYLCRLRGVVAGQTLSGSVSLDLAASQMNTSPRTLQRRLCEQGLKFGRIVEETRLGIAGALLRETEMSVQEIASRLGYNTPSGFARAFRRWSGTSPTAYRDVPA